MEIIGSVGVNGATLAQVARRHEVTRQQIYTWRHDLKKRGLMQVSPETVFFPLGTAASVRSTQLVYEESAGATSKVAPGPRAECSLRQRHRGLKRDPAHPVGGGCMFGPRTGVRGFLAYGVPDMHKVDALPGWAGGSGDLPIFQGSAKLGGWIRVAFDDGEQHIRAAKR